MAEPPQHVYASSGLAFPETTGFLHQLLDEVRLDHPEVATEDLASMETAVLELASTMVSDSGGDGATPYEFAITVEPDVLVGELRYDDGRTSWRMERRRDA